ncbi:hypothetical protein EJ08DRAFT_702951 [Tothia fuscella]|uniref:Uncharacterized protein n=1 Tax=Tothia fuscella TaxID=1048955 RepID=A0A9P4TTA3_9PEZI|nr:hypothetical protein EJ08DRAFT_702951 [Tothia fuscella]
MEETKSENKKLREQNELLRSHAPTQPNPAHFSSSSQSAPTPMAAPVIPLPTSTLRGTIKAASRHFAASSSSSSTMSSPFLGASPYGNMAAPSAGHNGDRSMGLDIINRLKADQRQNATKEQEVQQKFAQANQQQTQPMAAPSAGHNGDHSMGLDIINQLKASQHHNATKEQ